LAFSAYLPFNQFISYTTPPDPFFQTYREMATAIMKPIDT